MNLCPIHHVQMQFRLYPFGWVCHLCTPQLIVTTTNTSAPIRALAEGTPEGDN